MVPSSKMHLPILCLAATLVPSTALQATPKLHFHNLGTSDVMVSFLEEDGRETTALVASMASVRLPLRADAMPVVAFLKVEDCDSRREMEFSYEASPGNGKGQPILSPFFSNSKDGVLVQKGYRLGFTWGRVAGTVKYPAARRSKKNLERILAEARQRQALAAQAQLEPKEEEEAEMGWDSLCIIL